MGSCAQESTVYLEAYRARVGKQKLPNDTARLITKGPWQQLEQFEQTEKPALAAAKIEAKRYPEIKLFEDVPGIGLLRSQIYPPSWKHHIVLPIRESWMYAGWINEKVLWGKIYSEKLRQRL